MSKDHALSFWSAAETDRAMAIARRLERQQQQAIVDPHNKYILVSSNRELKPELQARLRSKRIGIDTETTGLDPLVDRIRLVQIAAPRFPVLLVDLFTLESVRLLQQFFARPMLKIMQHGIFDWAMLYQAGIVMPPPFFDTELAWLVLNQGLEDVPATLAYITRTVLKKTLSKAQQRSNWSGRLTPEQLEYAADDGIVLLELEPKLTQMLEEANLMATAQVEFNCMPALAMMGLNGIRFDRQRWQVNRRPLLAELKQLNQQIQELNPLQTVKATQTTLFDVEASASFNPNSPVQVKQALDKLKIKTKTTRHELLAPYAAKYPFIRALIGYRSLKRTMVTFEKTLPEHTHKVTGRIHAQFFQLGTVSGRIASNHPNVLNIPRLKAGRSCIAATPGNVLVKADYSQMELRIMARLSKDPVLLEAYQTGADIHRLTASFITGKPVEEVTAEARQLGKVVNFGLIYLMQAQKFQIHAYADYGIVVNRKQAEHFIQTFFDRYIGIQQFHERIRAYWKAGNRSIRTLAGRRRQWSGQPLLTEMINQPVQGLNADITKIALGKLVWELPGEAMLLLSPYDEILVECPEAIAEEVANIMQYHMVEAGRALLDPIPVEVEVKISETWS